MTAVRRVQLPAGAHFDDYTDYQVNYLNYKTGWLIPGTEIWMGGTLAVQINSLGCKGPELLPGVPVIGVFGDSTTFGVGLDAWPAHICIPGHQPLNCSVEGHDLARVAERYQQIRTTIDLAATVVGGSWHNLVYNNNTRDFWKSRFDSVGNGEPVAICTLATALVPECCDRGLDDAIAGTYVNGNRFVSWGAWPTKPDKTRELYEGVVS
jgi:hypothetical protein